jgi:hypothetical protein
MDLAHLSGLAAFAGSVVVALTSLVSSWLIKKHEARAKRARNDLARSAEIGRERRTRTRHKEVLGVVELCEAAG